jgi:hypothetical protein
MMKLKIDNAALAEEFFEGTRLLGIVAPVKGFQFCWHLNRCLGLDFRINHDIEIQLTKKTRNYYFAIFEYHSKLGSVKHYLYNNQNDGEYLLPEFKHLDFLWMIRDEIVSDEEVQALIDSIKRIPSVQLVMEMASDQIKNKQHLIF